MELGVNQGKILGHMVIHGMLVGLLNQVLVLVG